MQEELQSQIYAEVLERLILHLRKRKDVQNIDLMNLAGFCRNCLSKWYREEAKKKGLKISDPDSRKHVYGMSYEEWKKKFQKWNQFIFYQDANIIGRNNPRTYRHIIIKEAIIIAFTALIFILVIFLLISEIILQNYKACD